MNKMAVCLLAAAVLGTAGAGELVLANGHSEMKFDRFGRIVSVSERDGGRELLAKPTPFVGAGSSVNGRYEGSVGLEKRDGRFVFALAGGGHVTIEAESFGEGTTFRIVSCDAPGAKVLYVGRMAPACSKWLGRRANMASDEKSALCVRSYDLYPEMQASRHLLQVRIPVERAVGSRIGVVGAPRSKVQKALQAMTLASGRPHSGAGGAWALGSEATRGSYLNANVTAASLDDWIDLAERGGFDVLHFRENWYACRGQYPVNTNAWPNGLEDMKAAVRKIKASGYRAGLHTLTACIDPKDSWVCGPENVDLLDSESYTLAADLAPDADEMTVNEPPLVHHDVVFTYSGSGNAIRIGNEIVQYASFTKEPPYRYSGLKRGAFGTKPAAHKKGDKAGYLKQRYVAFYPSPDSPLADKVADAIGKVYNECGFDMIYCDGTEGMGTPYGMAVMRDKIIARCTADGRDCINEDSASGNSHSWWYHSRVGAWDSCYWAPKQFLDFHADAVKRSNVRDNDLLEVQMGWWAPLLSSHHFPAQKLDEMEYYASRNAGMDASMSIAGINISRRQLRFHTSRMMTVLGWYERARRAKAFLPDVQKAFDRKGAEFRFRQDAATGRWQVSPVQAFSYRAVSPESDRKVFRSTIASERGVLRVEALYAGEKPNGRNETVLTRGVKACDLVCATANKDVTMAVEDSLTDTGAKALRLVAANASGKARGAWARASAEFRPYRVLGRGWVMRFRVKGDGSGALLNVQPMTPQEYGKALAEHYVTLDFTGWRDFEMPLRERDAASYADYEWPYKGYAEVFHRIINYNNVSAVNFYLNEIPPGGKALVEISELAFVPQRQLKTKRHGVKINGTVVPVPFEMYSGWFAELEGRTWTLYSADGDPLRRAAATVPVPSLVAGENEIVYRGETADGTHPRAEVTLMAVGNGGNALLPVSSLPDPARKFLSYEAADPQFYAPEKGFDALAPLVVRPGETAKVELTLYGPTGECTLDVGGAKTRLPAIEKETHRKFTLDGEYRGVCPVTVTPENRNDPFEGRFEFVKRYR